MATDGSSNGFPREMARAMLKKHKVEKPPTPVEALVKAEGLEISLRSWGKQSRLDALLVSSHGLIAVNRDRPPARQRFSLAHELGHFALKHDYLKTLGADIDIDHPPENSHPTSGPFESQANDFAGELLVPRSMLIKLRSKASKADENEDSGESFRPFADLARRFQKSILSEEDLARTFAVSREVIFLALKRNGLL